MKEKLISIIIPCRGIDKYTKECINHCLRLNYSSFEIIVLPDKKEKTADKKIKVIATGKVKPAIKKNIGMKNAKGDFYAFIDSDAFPEENWLRNAVKYLKNEKIAMVGGPNLTPPDVDLMEQISGEILAMPIAAGFASVRYRKAKKQYVNELPSCNFIVKKEYAGEFDPKLLTAEDSKFCFDLKEKILYAPDVIVYHHRRNSLEGHLKQIFGYGRDMALLTKKEFSFNKLYYSLPSIFVVLVLIGFILSLSGEAKIFLSIFLIYLIAMLKFSIRNSFEKTILIFFGAVMTHFAYGIGYIYGLTINIKKVGLNQR